MSLLQVSRLSEKEIIEVRFHGRGGQGAVTAANILVDIAYRAGLWAQAFPFFGAERRGAPVMAFSRIGRGRIKVRSAIRNPDIVVVLDPKLPKLVDVTKGLKKGGHIVMNSSEPVEFPRDFMVWVVDATKIALDLGLVLAGWPLVNTAMLGALARVLGFPLDIVKEAVASYIGGRVGEINARSAERAFMEVRSVG